MFALAQDLSWILGEAKSIEDEIIEWRRRIHMYPELGYQEKRTAKLVEEKLREWGYEVETGVAETGVVGVLKGGRGGGRTIALRADMDALPIQELNDVPYRSRVKGVMHACGHDAHVAMLLGAAKILAKIKDRLNGYVKLIFQPAEEGGNGGKRMVEEGVLDDPPVDIIYAIHVWSSLPSGKVGLRAGPLLAATGVFEAYIKGKGGHGAYPHMTIDPIPILAQVIQGLQTIVSRNIDPTNPAVVSIGVVRAGTAFNVIPEEAYIAGTYRYLEPSVGETIKTRIREIIANTCKAYKAECKIKVEDKTPPTINNEKAVELAKNTIAQLIGEENIVEAKPSMGGEDFAYYLQKVPGAMIILGTGNPSKGTDKPHHSPYFNVDEEVLYIGTAIHVALAYKYLTPQHSTQ